MRNRERRSTPIKSFFTAIAVGVNVLLGMATVFSAYGGMISPDEMVFASIVAMMLPGFLIAGIILLVLDIMFWRKLSLVLIIAWIASAPPILEYCPLNVLPHKLTEQEKERTFTFLTYNVLHFWDFCGDVPGVNKNRTLDYILSTDADIVSLQEAESIEGPWKVTPDQLYELHTRYPYGYMNVAKQLTLLSKYPAEHVHIDMPPCISERVACFRLNVKGDTIHLFNVHLESIGLSPEDKELYMQLYNPSPERKLKEEISEVKTQLISKLAKAFRERAEQARALRECIDSIGGNIIVAGDFNDIPGCYAIRTIAGDDFKSAFTECGFGPTVTYHGNRFYFRMDHVLYHGNFEAVKIKRAKIPSSDHYPLLTTFMIEN